MSRCLSPSTAVASAAVFYLSLGALPAASLLMDFGTGGPTGAATGTDAAVSPGNSAHVGETFWNYGSTLSSTSLKYADGTTDATGVVVDIGAEVSATQNVVNFSGTPSVVFASVTGGGAGVGSIYAGNRPARNGVFNNAGAIGARISGLAAGTYQIYVTGRNTNASAVDTTTNFYLGVATASIPTTYQFAGSGNTTSQTLGATLSAASLSDTTFTNGQTFVRFNSITIGAGDSILIAVEGQTGDVRGFLNSIEIVAVPEPSVLAVSATSLGVLMLRRKRGFLSASQ